MVKLLMSSLTNDKKFGIVHEKPFDDLFCKFIVIVQVLKLCDVLSTFQFTLHTCTDRTVMFIVMIQ